MPDDRPWRKLRSWHQEGKTIWKSKGQPKHQPPEAPMALLGNKAAPQKARPKHTPPPKSTTTTTTRVLEEASLPHMANNQWQRVAVDKPHYLVPPNDPKEKEEIRAKIHEDLYKSSMAQQPNAAAATAATSAPEDLPDDALLGGHSEVRNPLPDDARHWSWEEGEQWEWQSTAWTQWKQWSEPPPPIQRHQESWQQWECADPPSPPIQSPQESWQQWDVPPPPPIPPPPISQTYAAAKAKQQDRVRGGTFKRWWTEYHKIKQTGTPQEFALFT